MSKDIKKFLDFHREKGGTGKLFNFKFINYQKGFLELSGEFNDLSLNPDGSVQGGMMTSMLDDVTALLLIYESNGTLYPSSTDLHTLHHRPLFRGKVTAKAFLIKRGRNIATVRGELFNQDNKLITTLVHTVFLIDRENRF